ncbi:MAG: CapA family protein [Actinobacteria bacterium]|nr:MAG: CapA family protein [Actinomycetota bacterium]
MTRTLQNRLKRQQAKRQALFIVLGTSLVVGVVIAVFALTAGHYPGNNGNAVSYTQTAGEVVEPSEMQYTDPLSSAAPPLSLGIGGDVTFGLAVADIVAREGPGYPWSDIAPLLGEYDITVANLEGPLCRGTDPHPDQSSIYLRGEASCATPMAGAGIDAVCLANDHIMDYGAAGLEETLSILRNEKVGAFGAGSNSRAAEQPLVLEAANGASVALLSFCDVAPAAYGSGEETPGISAPSPEHLGEMVEQAADKTPYVVVFMHWGEVGSSDITPRQRELAQVCVAAGADLVVGCHPHVLQGIEILQGVPVIYSLGNLVYSSESEGGKSGIFAACRFSGGVLANLQIIPLRVEGARPVALAGSEAENVLGQLGEASPGVQLDISPATGTATLRL